MLVGFICHKGKIIWGISPLDKPFLLQGTVGQNKYEIIIKQTRIFKEADIGKL
jgi:hypothetical protein